MGAATEMLGKQVRSNTHRGQLGNVSHAKHVIQLLPGRTLAYPEEHGPVALQDEHAVGAQVAKGFWGKVFGCPFFWETSLYTPAATSCPRDSAIQCRSST